MSTNLISVLSAGKPVEHFKNKMFVLAETRICLYGSYETLLDVLVSHVGEPALQLM